MPVAAVSPAPAAPAVDEPSEPVSKLSIDAHSSTSADDSTAHPPASATSATAPAPSLSSSQPAASDPVSSSRASVVTASNHQPLSTSAPTSTSTSTAVSSAAPFSPLYAPPPSAALPSSSPFLPATLRAAPGQLLTVEGADNRRHTYADDGTELGNDPLTGVYEEVEIEDMEWEAAEKRWSYPCPCGDRFVLTAEELMDGESIARCPSCSLVIKVIYDPEDVFEQEGDSDDD